MKKLLLFLAAFTLALPAFGQTVGPLSLTGTQCAPIATFDQTATVAIYVSGSWSGTIQPQGTIQGQAAFNVQVSPANSSTPQATITANGAYVAAVAGLTTFQICGASITGTARVFLNGSQSERSAGAGLTFPITVDSGQTISPINLGQIAATQYWGLGGIPLPVLSAGGAGTGGIANNHLVRVQVSYNTALGETVPSNEATQNISGCGTNNCSVLVTHPTLPPGYISYNVYSSDNGLTLSELKQTTSNNCVAITGDCVIQLGGAGAAPLTVQTAFVQPANTQATECPPGVIPTGFIQSADGNYHTQFGVDPLSNNISPAGTWTICRRTFFNDTKSSPAGFNNSFVAIDHIAGTGTSAANQDRSLSVFMANPIGDTATRYAMEGIQAELDFNGHPVINGSPDGEVSVASLQFADSTTATVASPTQFGLNLLRGSFSRSNTGGASPAMTGVNIQMFNNSATAGGSANMVAYKAWWQNFAGTGLGGTGYLCTFPTDGTKMSLQNICAFANAAGAFTPGIADYLVRSDINNLQSLLNGPVWVQSILGQVGGTIPITESVAVGGSLKTSQLVTPDMNTPVCSGGASSYSYQLVGIDGVGNSTAASTLRSTAASCTNPLTSGNPVSLGGITGWNKAFVAAVSAGASRIDIYRTAGPMTTGKIGCIGAPGSGCVVICPGNNGLAYNGNGCVSFSDTGLTGDATTPPTVNTTGQVNGVTIGTATNCANSGGTCGSAAAGRVSIAAAATTVTVATTAVGTNSEIQVSEDSTLGAALGVTCNTTLGRTYAVTTRTALTSFVVTASAAPAANPACLSYTITNY